MFVSKWILYVRVYRKRSVPSKRVGQGDVGFVVVAICVWGGRPWWRSRSQSWRSSFLIAPPSGVAGWKCGGGESTPLLDTSGLDSCRLPPILPPHRRFTPAMGTLGTVCSIAPLCSSFRSVASFNLDDSTLTISYHLQQIATNNSNTRYPFFLTDPLLW